MTLAAQQATTWDIASTIATFLAVLVALFGPSARHWWRKPRLRVEKQDRLDFTAWAEDMTGDIADEGGSLISLGITNTGNEQANDVQVFLTLQQEMDVREAFPESKRPYAYSRKADLAPVPFLHREGGRYQETYSVGMPAKYPRPLQLMKLSGSLFKITTSARSEAKALADGKYIVVLTLVSASTPTVRYAGILAVDGAFAAWLRRPKRLRFYRDTFFGPPRRLRRLARRHNVKAETLRPKGSD